MEMKEIWIVKGRVTDTDAHPAAKLGDVEWQFSDGPPGKRGSSADYLSLEEGLRDHTGAVFHFVPEPTPRFIVKYRHAAWGAAHMIFDNNAGGWIDGKFDVPVAAQAYADLLNAEDARPLPNNVKIRADAADHAGRVLDALLASSGDRDELHGFWTGHFDHVKDRAMLRTVANALLALGNDTDAIVTE